MLTKTSKEKTQKQSSAKSLSTNKGASSAWLVIKSGAGKGMSAPEYFIKNPSEFMDEFYNVDYDNDDPLSDREPDWDVVDQANKIMGALNRIKPPPRYKRKKAACLVAVLYYDKGPSIEIVTDMKRKLKLSDSVGHVAYAPIDQLFDQIVFLHVLSPPQFTIRHAVNNVLSEITGQNVEKWNRAQCEWFFDTRSDFFADPWVTFPDDDDDDDDDDVDDDVDDDADE